MYQAVVRKREKEWNQKEIICYEIYKGMLVTAKPGEEYTMLREDLVGGYFQNVCIYGKMYTVKNKTWKDLDMPVRSAKNGYFRKYGTLKNSEKEAVQYLQEKMKEQDENAPEIVTDNKKYIYRGWYAFNLPEEYAASAKLKL
jgi:gamma-glutamylcyclotransferase (GGCT)/AIG2-like uncharacterized protein YtfP